MNAINMQFPRKFQPVLTSKKRIIVLVGGRDSAKSTSVAQHVLTQIKMHGIDVLCGREFQLSIEDSVHKLVLSLIDRLNISGVTSTDKKVDFDNGGRIRYKGFARNSSGVRSAEGYKLSWIEEAQYLSDESIKDLLPTIREEGSQLIFTANLMASTDPFSRRFIMPFWKVLQRDGIYEDEMSLIIMMNYRDNPWSSSGMRLQRKSDKENLSAAEYDHIWEGAFNDSVDDSIIKVEWFDAAVDAHIKLGFEPKGQKVVAHDPSDTGSDAKGLVYRHGSVILDVQEKVNGDVNDGCDWATGYTIKVNADMFVWDCDGLGVTLQRQVREALEGKKIDIRMFKGSQSPTNPTRKYEPDERLEYREQKTNEETFKNRRAQSYIKLRDGIFNAYCAVVKREYIDPDKIISISSEIKCLSQFRSELCRIPIKDNQAGLIQIMSKIDMKRIHRIESPNLADSAMMSTESNLVFKQPEYEPFEIPDIVYLGQT